MTQIKQFKVIGNPIQHSLSPIIHHYFADVYGINLNYEKECIDIEENNFENFVHTFFKHKLNAGLNITLPFKERAFLLAKYTSLEAQYAKASNTLYMKDGDIHSHNTDGLGLVADIYRQNITLLQDKNILLLGAGGASRGVLYPLCKEHPKSICIGNRRLITAQKLIADAQVYLKDMPNLHIQALELEKLCNQESKLPYHFDVIINATSLGFQNDTHNDKQPDKFMLHASYIHQHTFAYDMIYNHASPFFTWAQQQKLNTRDGLGMLVHQAAFAFSVWHGIIISEQDIINVLQILTDKF
jgi:shikimate dehydrogenase